MSELNDFRARESFDTAIEDMCRRVGTVTTNVGSIAGGGLGSVVLTVPDAIPDVGMTVQVGLPSALSNGFVVWSVITASGEVTIYLYNRTGGAIDPDLGVYSARVMP